ncbi:DUF6445 family protein [Lentzea pudingi]|nr:DUF6445 family protein [Lentzea pudingi]
MRTRMIVVDDFYDNADAVRESALDSSFISMGKYNYPGWQADKALSSEALWDRLELLIGAPLEREVSGAFGAFRLISEETGSKTKVHADSASDWAALVYLTPDAPPSCGTGFYRHRPSGFFGPPTDEQAHAFGSADAEEFDSEVCRPDMADKAKWDLVGQVGPVYNRFVAFRGRELFHAPMGGCGVEPNECRLTQIFFFDEKR